MISALLLDLAGVDREVIAAEYALVPEQPARAGAAAPAGPDRGDILQMLGHVSAAYGSTSGYLDRLGLDDVAVGALRARLEP